MNDLTFASLVRAADNVLSVSWKETYDNQYEELSRMFAQYGDRAYGVWIQACLAPVHELIAAEGFLTKAGFNRANSVENWGPPEERERCVWYTVQRGDGTAAGTLVMQVFHSHKSFHIPRAPRLFALEAIEGDDIVAALSNASSRIRWDVQDRRQPLPDNYQPAGTPWEYATDVALADCAKPLEDGQLHSWHLDEAVSRWGRYGWELVSVVPSGDRLIAFYKRPCLLPER